jgi:methylenetetrahydrofolate dehydrogenase (NADP+)/methenyltetrahydrofolate cyclohydrolase
MSARILDGEAFASQIHRETASRVSALLKRGITPRLVFIRVGEDPASRAYVSRKETRAKEVGISSHTLVLPESTPLSSLLAEIDALNADPKVHGILIQSPLPSALPNDQVYACVSPAKDVDGFHVNNAGLLMTGQPLFRPCTPYGVMKMLESINYPIRGANAVVVGASNIVGKPQAMLLLQAGATVTICNSKTRDLGHHTRNADILVVATGKRNIVTADMVKPGAVVIDVGMNRDDAGKLCGDVDYGPCAEVAGWITPVPGGVGPMTITMLLVNTVEAAERN